MIKKIKLKVVSRHLCEEGKHLMDEIRGLKENTVIDAVVSIPTGAADFSFNGDSVLWLGINCVPAPQRLTENEVKDLCEVFNRKGNTSYDTRSFAKEFSIRIKR